MLVRRILILVVILAVLFTGTVYSQDEEAGELPGFDSWEDVLAAADGTTVRWHLWGGSDGINEFVDTFYGPALEEYGVTLERVPLADTVDAVNMVIDEYESGMMEGGSVDMIWINGENYWTLRQMELLYGPWSEAIPNGGLVDWENPAINLDFGNPVDGYESPWSSAQFQFVYDSERLTEDDLPHSIAELEEWIMEHPGEFTYIAPGPGGFIGTRFVKAVLFEMSGGNEQWLGEFNEELYNEWAPQLWEKLNSWKPYLWNEGATYPTDPRELDALFSNGEVQFTMTQSAAGAGTAIADGLIPESSRAFVFDDYMIGDFNYVAIPVNANNVAGALILANLILRPDLQAAQVIPTNGFGLGYAIDIRNVTDEDDLAILELAQQTFGDAASDPASLAAALTPDLVPEYQTSLEEDWAEFVLNQ